MKKRIVSIVVMTVLVLALCTPLSFAATKRTRSMTVYNDLIKSKSIVYCAAGQELLKVDLKTKTVISLAKTDYSGYGEMKLKNGYLYFVDNGDIYASLMRIKTSGSSLKRIGSLLFSGSGYPYVISGSRIYYKDYSSSGNIKIKQMTLNGKHKKKASGIKIKTKYKSGNAKGYSIIKEYSHMGQHPVFEDSLSYYDFYLRLPDGETIYLTNGF